MIRVDNRNPDEMRPVKISPDYLRFAEGSVLIEIGNTKAICAASVSPRVPPHLIGTGQGWVTAEYSLLPRSCQQRVQRERPCPSGRSQEIQRMIGRCLRGVVDLALLGERTITVDCDVLEADGGTRTACITGGFVALAMGLKKMKQTSQISRMPLRDYLAAISVGIVEGEPVADLCYLEDMQADVDMNIAMNGKGEFIELQGTAEKIPFNWEQMSAMIDLASQCIVQLIEIQRDLLKIEFEIK